MKVTLPAIAGVAVLVALTKGPLGTALRRAREPGYFEPLFFYKRSTRRPCVCAVHVERIEAAMEAIVCQPPPTTILRTLRVPLGAVAAPA